MKGNGAWTFRTSGEQREAAVNIREPEPVRVCPEEDGPISVFLEQEVEHEAGWNELEWVYVACSLFLHKPVKSLSV